MALSTAVSLSAVNVARNRISASVVLTQVVLSCAHTRHVTFDADGFVICEQRLAKDGRGRVQTVVFWSELIVAQPALAVHLNANGSKLSSYRIRFHSVGQYDLFYGSFSRRSHNSGRKNLEEANRCEYEPTADGEENCRRPRASRPTSASLTSIAANETSSITLPVRTRGPSRQSKRHYRR